MLLILEILFFKTFILFYLILLLFGRKTQKEKERERTFSLPNCTKPPRFSRLKPRAFARRQEFHPGFP